YDVNSGERDWGNREDTLTLADTLDAVSFISAPVFRHHEFAGRIYFSILDKRGFDTSDVDFLMMVLKHVGTIIENIRLFDRMASDAAQEERRRIARDIHDSVIQPYIGFQIGLSGMRHKLAVGSVDVNHEIDRLLEMTNIGITDLRRYVGGLKG